jgi:hypothetical protein
VLGSVASEVLAGARTPVLVWPHSVPRHYWAMQVGGQHSVPAVP